MSSKPVIILAFANDQEGHRYLRDLPEELRRLQAILEAAARDELCELVVRPNATLDLLFKTFTEHSDRVAIFHYGGHAGGDRLLLETKGGGGAVAHAEGLATFLRQQRNLKLVFLNGCATRAQAAGLLDAGAASVIATARAIEDAVAVEFATAFYAALASGRTLRASYEAARGRVMADRGPVPQAYVRDLGGTSQTLLDAADERGFPWELRLAPGAELADRWSLPEAVDDPLFGLPPLKVDWLPEIPYRGLQRFTSKEAALFFGRGHAIRELYNLVLDPGTRPVILYYGPTGVGKSSVLDAGLTPRLEYAREVLYLRRDPELGLLGALRFGLASGKQDAYSGLDLASLWLGRERDDKPLLVILDQAEEVFTRPRMSDGPDAELAELVAALRATFAGADPSQRPKGKLIVSFRREWLDQFEQAFNAVKLGFEPMPLNPLERRGIIEVIEGPTRDPDLKRLYQLTVDDDLAPTIAGDLVTDAGSAVAPTLQVLLTNMWKGAGGKGGRFDHALYRRLRAGGYLLRDVIEDGLQAVRLWRDDAASSGLALDLLAYHVTEFDAAAQRTMDELMARYPHRSDLLPGLIEKLKDSYLLLEADARSEPATRLAHDTLGPLVHERFRASIAPGQRARRLLDNRVSEWQDGKTGPVLDATDLSAVEAGAAGMRAWTTDETRLVEASRQADDRRLAKEKEQADKLREAQEQKEKARRDEEAATKLRLKEQEEANQKLQQRAYLLGIALLAMIVAAALAVGQRNEAQEQTRIAESRRLAALSDSVRPKRLDQAILLALEASAGDTLEARASLQRSIDDRPELSRFLHIPEGSVTDVVFGPDGRIAAAYNRRQDGRKPPAGGVILFDTGGKRLASLEVEGWVSNVAFRPESHVAAVYHGNVSSGVALFDAGGKRLPNPTLEPHFSSVAFGPEGRIAAGYNANDGGIDRGRVDVFDSSGKRLASLEVKEGRVDSVAFGSEGQIAAGYTEHEGGSGVALIEAGWKQLPAPLKVKGWVSSVAFGPEGRVAAAYSGIEAPGGLQLFDALGHPLTSRDVKEGRLTNVAFGPEGKIAAGYSTLASIGEPPVGGVVLFDAGGGPLTSLEVKEGAVNSVAFGPEGRIAAGYRGIDGGGGVVFFDATEQRLLLASREIEKGEVSSVAFGPEGRIAAGYRGIGGGGVVLFDASEKLRASVEVKEGVVNTVAFGPEGRIAAGYSNPASIGEAPGGVVLFNAVGTQLASSKVKGGAVNTVAFGPEGRIAAGYSNPASTGEAPTGGVVFFNAVGTQLASSEVKEGAVNSVAFGPESRIAAGYRGNDSGGVVLLAPSGKWLRSAPLKVSEGDVGSVAFEPDGQIGAAYSRRHRGDEAPAGGVVLFDACWKRLLPAPLEVSEGVISSVAFGPAGRIAAGYYSYRGHVRGDSGVVLFDASGKRLLPAPLKVKKGWINSVAFGPEGRIAAGYGDGVGGASKGGVVLFDADPTSWRARAAHVVNRNFTREEWRQFFADTAYRRTIRHFPWPIDLTEDEWRKAEAFERQHPVASGGLAAD